ncbi:SCA7-domain-containing protein [Sporormia fimetaria CBS 119925]|uniref:SCA7-domain-containing protein n=1 Tax=Sporormia fimetaria CBS 119925 TaxID=1340428 RepID=A0A6A6VKL3_9PLEO|nr:SCA7-domain-containing protein [Sporormia fimetaria CBS 119925]
MAANNGARKAPTPVSPTKNGPIDKEIVKSALNQKQKKPALMLKLKKPVPKPTKPGNWKESEAINVKSKEDSAQNGATSPLVNRVDDAILSAFLTGRTMEDKPDVVQCKHCRRPVLRSVSANHIRECLNKKQEKLKKKKEAKEAKDAALRKEKGQDDDDGRAGASKTAGVDGDGAKKGKKRKLDGDAEKAPNAKKKKKDEPKAKVTKTKGPVDVEKQCGVALPNGGFCARSLTCKSHPMGLKRAVPGRSLPYDMLLAQYQKKNQAKQQRAALDANAPLPEDLEPSGAVDSEEEKELVMTALSRYRPAPLATFTPVSQRNKYQFIRMKDMLRSALGGPVGGGSIFGTNPNSAGLGIMGAPSSATTENFPTSATGFGSAGVDASTAGAMNPASRRQSGVTNPGPRHILPGQLPGPQRKSSVASTAG